MQLIMLGCDAPYWRLRSDVISTRLRTAYSGTGEYDVLQVSLTRPSAGNACLQRCG